MTFFYRPPKKEVLADQQELTYESSLLTQDVV